MSYPDYPSPYPPKTNKLAIVSVVTGAIGIFLGWCTFAIPSIVAIVTGHLALKQIKRNGKLDELGRKLAILGLGLGYFSLLITLALTIVAIVAGTWSFDIGTTPSLDD